MDVRVVLLVGPHDRLDHLPRPLAGGRVVEVDQRHAIVDGAGENGKIGPQLLGVEGLRLARRGNDRHEVFSAVVGGAPATPLPGRGE